MAKNTHLPKIAIESQASAASLRSQGNTTGTCPPSSPTKSQFETGTFQSVRGTGNIRVVVRVRGLNAREEERGATCLIDMDPHTQTTTLYPPSEERGSRKIEKKTFTFDNSFWSASPYDEHYADQETIYTCLGEEFLDHNFEGYHTCIFAYGQTGAGKSYTMMGPDHEPGLIPRTCEDLFERIESNDSPDVSYSVRVSYFEVYNEQVRDLLAPRTDPPRYLKVRECPTEGPHVKDLIDVPVRNYAEVIRYMRLGDTNRTVASTKMNDTSSRSHAVFTLMLRQVHHDVNTDATTERTARIRLVDLAGSERAVATGATGVRLREGGNINKSLSTLGRVIAALAGGANMNTGQRAKKEVVPYRDSVLTWLLKDSLGGNSKTAMIACISPADYEETLSTLRYADQAKHIKTRATVNEDQISTAVRDSQIEDLQEVIRTLQLQIGTHEDTQKQNESRARELEEYQNQVTQLQRLMEDQKQIDETRIRSLQTQNEAMRLHIKLISESMRRPITVPPPQPIAPPDNVVKEHRKPEEQVQNGAPPPSPSPPPPQQQQQQTESVVDEGVGSEWDSEDERDTITNEIEIRVDDLLRDIALFRRKCMEAKARIALNSLQDGQLALA